MAYLIIFWGSLKAALGLTNPRTNCPWTGKLGGENEGGKSYDPLARSLDQLARPCHSSICDCRNGIEKAQWHPASTLKQKDSQALGLRPALVVVLNVICFV